jgi:hypothetical protein
MGPHQIRLAAHLAIGFYYTKHSKLMDDCVVAALKKLGWDVVNEDVSDDDMVKVTEAAEAMRAELLSLL